MLDIYLKRLVIHQFSPTDTELFLSETLTTMTPRIDAYFRKKLSKVFSEDAKRGQFEAGNDFFAQITDDLLETSYRMAKLWKEAFVVSEDQKTNDLVFIQFDKEGQEHLAFLRITLKEILLTWPMILTILLPLLKITFQVQLKLQMKHSL